MRAMYWLSQWNYDCFFPPWCVCSEFLPNVFSRFTKQDLFMQLLVRVNFPHRRENFYPNQQPLQLFFNRGRPVVSTIFSPGDVDWVPSIFIFSLPGNGLGFLLA